ncbi:MAG: pro-sigmaK processing inhibitor BofA family protein [Clostridia bacterium]|nr:pro-sigmaK processing inhibitor BofA family protein [Clostridia bacterium]
MFFSTFSTASLLTLPAAAAVLYMMCLRYDPKKPHARMLRHGVVGLLMLLGWNLLPLPGVGVNPISVWVTGWLGLPGAGLMAVINLLP